MWKYMREHEAWIREQLAGSLTPGEIAGVLRIHDRMIVRMQHERLIHLMVTLAVALFALLSVGFAVLTQLLFSFVLSLLLLGLTSAYLVHYKATGKTHVTQGTIPTVKDTFP